MSVTEERTGDITVLHVEGDLAGPNAESMRELAAQSLRDGRRDFIIDLTNANTCDSAGLEALTWLQRQCEDQLGLVKLAGVGDTMRKILQITRLSHRFEDEYSPY